MAEVQVTLKLSTAELDVVRSALREAVATAREEYKRLPGDSAARKALATRVTRAVSLLAKVEK